MAYLFGGLAQLARAPALHAGGQRFESVILHSRKKDNDKAGSCGNTSCKTAQQIRCGIMRGIAGVRQKNQELDTNQKASARTVVKSGIPAKTSGLVKIP